MEKIKIKNFGPVTEAEIVVRDINVFIGTTSSGKSTVAKLLSIFRDSALNAKTNYRQFNQMLSDYNIDFVITGDCEIRYEYFDFYFEVKKGEINSNYSSKIAPQLINPVYIPAERIFFPTISQSIFSLMSSNVSLPKWFLDFGASFENARKSLKRFSIDFLKVSYEFDDSSDFVKLGNNTKVRLSQASSGLQSVIPLILVVQHTTDRENGTKDMLVIEEPELNLYPSSQKSLIEFIIQSVNNSNDKLIITTHSPYLLTALDNLIQADNAASINPARKKEISSLVPEKNWVNFSKVSCYYFTEGTCKSTLDEEMKSIGPSNIDDVSIELSETFEKLLGLKYND